MITVYDNSLYVILTPSQLEDPTPFTMPQVRPKTSAKLVNMITVHDNSIHVTLTISQLEDPTAFTMPQMRPPTCGQPAMIATDDNSLHVTIAVSQPAVSRCLHNVRGAPHNISRNLLV
jgi:hypothetical protein